MGNNTTMAIRRDLKEKLNDMKLEGYNDTQLLESIIRIIQVLDAIMDRLDKDTKDKIIADLGLALNTLEAHVYEKITG